MKGKIIVLLMAALVIFGWALVGKAQEPQENKFPPLAALGPPPIPRDNPQSLDEKGFPRKDDPKVQLGKMLFFDSRLSGDAGISCAECHNPTLGWGDGQDVSKGYPGTVHWRNSQNVVNAAYYTKIFWEGNVTSLEAQAEAAATGAVAGNGAGGDMMEERLRQVPEYIKRFKEVFGTERPELTDAWNAISAFERTIYQVDTPFDKYLRGDKTALSGEAKKGLELFQGKAGCIQCHNGAFFTDEKYYNLGVPENLVFEQDPQRQITFRFQQYSKGVPEEVYRKNKIDLGLYYNTKQKGDMGKFRTPTLRYTLYTPPYMHNGAFFSLEEVVDFYNQGGGEGQVKKLFGFGTKTDKLKPLNLTDDEKAALVAFLESLSGDEIIVESPKLPDYAVMK